MNLRAAPLLLALLAACGTASEPPASIALDAAATPAPDAAPREVMDAGSVAPDAEAPSIRYTGDVQPLLQERCYDCHATGNEGLLPPFPDDYAALSLPARRCPGRTVGECVGLALENQIPEGDRCRTAVVEPFHREGWLCLSPQEIAHVQTWLSGGMRE